jgi:hypothetical protein
MRTKTYGPGLSQSFKNMNIMKSPGNDGFTTELYKLFWLDVKKILVKPL